MFKDAPVFSSFSVDDLAVAREFYGTTLGIDVEENEMGLQLHTQGGVNIFIYPKLNHEPATYTVLNFSVKDIDAATDQLIAKGITLEKYPNLNLPDIHQDEKGIARGTAANMGPDIAWFKDPAGNILAVVQGS